MTPEQTLRNEAARFDFESEVMRAYHQNIAAYGGNPSMGDVYLAIYAAAQELGRLVEQTGKSLVTH